MFVYYAKIIIYCIDFYTYIESVGVSEVSCRWEETILGVPHAGRGVSHEVCVSPTILSARVRVQETTGPGGMVDHN